MCGGGVGSILLLPLVARCMYMLIIIIYNICIAPYNTIL